MVRSLNICQRRRSEHQSNLVSPEELNPRNFTRVCYIELSKKFKRTGGLEEERMWQENQGKHTLQILNNWGFKCPQAPRGQRKWKPWTSDTTDRNRWELWPPGDVPSHPLYHPLLD